MQYKPRARKNAGTYDPGEGGGCSGQIRFRILETEHLNMFFVSFHICQLLGSYYTVCQGSSDPQEKIFNIFASENEVYAIY